MSTATIELNEKTYAQLLGRTLPHVINSDKECERLTKELVRLDERDKLSPEEKELAELLTILIDEYEDRRYPIRKASPQQTLQHLMEARKLTQKDLKPKRRRVRRASRPAHRTYENKHYPIRDASPVEIIAELMAANNLRQKDLIGIFGSESMVSMVLSASRPPSVEHIEGLSRRFRISPAAFFPTRSLKEMKAE